MVDAVLDERPDFCWRLALSGYFSRRMSPPEEAVDAVDADSDSLVPGPASLAVRLRHCRLQDMSDKIVKEQLDNVTLIVFLLGIIKAYFEHFLSFVINSL